MADNKTPETRSMKDMLSSIDRDMASMPLPVRRQERTSDEQQRVADLTGDVLRKAAEDATNAVMLSVTEAEGKVAALRVKAEEAMAQLKSWTDDFARQNTELIEKCTALESSINETVQHIIQIGQKPLNGNSRGELK